MDGTVKATATVKQKMTTQQEEAAIAVAQLERESADADAQAAVTEQPEATPAKEGEVLPKEQMLNIKVSDFARIVADASMGRTVRPYQLKAQSESMTERILDNTLGAVGDGMHRVADGARDIVGGLIDIVTLGRAGRR